MKGRKTKRTKDQGGKKRMHKAKERKEKILNEKWKELNEAEQMG